MEIKTFENIFCMCLIIAILGTIIFIANSFMHNVRDPLGWYIMSGYLMIIGY